MCPRSCAHAHVPVTYFDSTAIARPGKPKPRHVLRRQQRHIQVGNALSANDQLAQAFRPWITGAVSGMS